MVGLLVPVKGGIGSIFYPPGSARTISGNYIKTKAKLVCAGNHHQTFQVPKMEGFLWSSMLPFFRRTLSQRFREIYFQWLFQVPLKGGR